MKGGKKGAVLFTGIRSSLLLLLPPEWIESCCTQKMGKDTALCGNPGPVLRLHYGEAAVVLIVIMLIELGKPECRTELGLVRSEQCSRASGAERKRHLCLPSPTSPASCFYAAACFVKYCSDRMLIFTEASSWCFASELDSGIWVQRWRETWLCCGQCAGWWQWMEVYIHVVLKLVFGELMKSWSVNLRPRSSDNMEVLYVSVSNNF